MQWYNSVWIENEESKGIGESPDIDLKNIGMTC